MRQGREREREGRSKEGKKMIEKMKKGERRKGALSNTFDSAGQVRETGGSKVPCKTIRAANSLLMLKLNPAVCYGYEGN